jgi:hypothetical protein
MLSPGRAAVLAAARASGIVLPFQMSSGSGDMSDDDDDGGDERRGGDADAAASPLSRVHDSVLEAVLARLDDARSKCAAAATCRRIAELLSEPRHWRVLALDSAGPLPPPPPPPPPPPSAAAAAAGAAPSSSSGSPDNHSHNNDGCSRPLSLPHPPPPPDAAARRGLALARLLARAEGQIEAVRLSGCRAARDRERRARFDLGLRRGAALPHTRGLRALALASLLGESCGSLALDERASPIGGMTDDLARALAAHCLSLTSLEVAFGRYSPPAELFTDEGVAALALGCGGGKGPLPPPGRCPLARLALVNCDRLTDRALYAAAAGWGATLEELEIGGYNEHVSDVGLGVLLEATRAATGGGLRVARLGARLPKVTDATGRLLARLCRGTLEEAALSSAMTGQTLEALAEEEGGCPWLRRLDASACAAGSIEPGALARLVLTCPRLESVRLPAGAAGATRAAAAAAAAAVAAAIEVVVVVEEEAEDEGEVAARAAADDRDNNNNDNDKEGSGDGAGRNRRGSWTCRSFSSFSSAAAHSSNNNNNNNNNKPATRPNGGGGGGGGGASFARPAPEPRDLSCSPVFAFLTSEAGGWDAPQRLLASGRRQQGFGGGFGGGAVAADAAACRARIVELRVVAAGAASYDLD